MKKLISILLTVSLLFIIAACGMPDGNSPGVSDDIENGANDIIDETEDMADDMIDDTKDFADDMTNGTDDTPAEMPDDTIDGTMEDTETVQ
ncbi:MAG: hypothetical protein IKL74_03360 [Clostridia bacterium]|nr:hypothetical protein [Clostridia bacterium]